MLQLIKFPTGSLNPTTTSNQYTQPQSFYAGKFTRLPND